MNVQSCPCRPSARRRSTAGRAPPAPPPPPATTATAATATAQPRRRRAPPARPPPPGPLLRREEAVEIGARFLVGRGFDLRVHHRRLRLADVERDASERAARQAAARHLRQVLPPSIDLMDAAARTAAGEAPRRAPVLDTSPPRGCSGSSDRSTSSVPPVFSPRYSVFVHVLPPSVGHEDAAIGVRSVEMSRGRDPDDVRILRMDDHARDRVRVAQADVLELDVGGVRRERVGALPDAVAERARLAVVRFAGADVEDVRIGRREREVADRADAVALEDRRRRSCRCSSCARRRSRRSRRSTRTGSAR